MFATIDFLTGIQRAMQNTIKAIVHTYNLPMYFYNPYICINIVFNQFVGMYLSISI